MSESKADCPCCGSGSEIYGRQFYRNSLECGCAGFPEENVEDKDDEGVDIQNNISDEVPYSDQIADGVQTYRRNIFVNFLKRKDINGKFEFIGN